MESRSAVRRNIDRFFMLVLCASLAGSAACSDDPDGGANNSEPTDTGADAVLDGGPDAEEEDAADAADATGDADAEPDASDPYDQPDCDSLQPARCEFPWPSNLFLRPDEQRTTGYTLNFGAETLPVVEEGPTTGLQTEPDPYRRLDGYEVGTPLMVMFPDVDTSEMAGERSIERSMEADSPIVWLEVDDNGDVVRHIPHFAELDSRADSADEQVLFVRPAVILDEGSRYVVAFRNLQDTTGSDIEPSEAFAKLRDGDTDADEVLEGRQARFDEIFDILEGEGVQRDELTLAWDFVTASSDATHGPMLHMRDRGFEITGEDGPQIEFTTVKENTEDDHDYWWLQIEGTFESPRFMKDKTIRGQTGSVFNWGEDGLPEANGTHEQTFWLYVPHSAKDGSDHGLIQYGHGLLGAGSQTGGSFNGKIANDHKFIFFGTSLAGMSNEDNTSALLAVQNLNAFPFLADRLHQGMLEFLLLARSMRERLPAHDEFTSRNISVNTDELFYSGISQGGIFGGTYMALSTDVTYGHLGVPGNNYSTLLHRSVDFDPFFEVMRRAYSSPVSQAIALSTIQLLWSQTDPSSYLRHITAEPFEGNDPHYALFAPAKGDWQVSVMTNEIAARSDIDIALMENYDDERDVALVDEQAYPYTGSGVVLYDFGNPWPEPGNSPPDDDLGDPHGDPRQEDHHNEQMIHFFRNGGEIIDVCGGDGCHPD